jgi:hypothetical protein
LVGLSLSHPVAAQPGSSGGQRCRIANRQTFKRGAISMRAAAHAGQRSLAGLGSAKSLCHLQTRLRNRLAAKWIICREGPEAASTALQPRSAETAAHQCTPRRCSIDALLHGGLQGSQLSRHFGQDLNPKPLLSHCSSPWRGGCFTSGWCLAADD